jgi:hypothetical protein
MAEGKEEKEQLLPTQEQLLETINQLTMAMQDILAKTDLIVSDFMNLVTTLNNVKNQYLKFMGQLRQKSISSK